MPIVKEMKLGESIMRFCCMGRIHPHVKPKVKKHATKTGILFLKLENAKSMQSYMQF